MNRNDIVKLGIFLIFLAIHQLLAHMLHQNTPPLYNTIKGLKYASVIILIMVAGVILHMMMCGTGHHKSDIKLNLTTLCSHVYGMGILMYITTYCLLDIASVSSMLFYISVGCITVNDILESNNVERRNLDKLLSFSASCISCTLHVLSRIQEDDTQEIVDALIKEQWIVPFFGVLLPFIGPFFFIGIRSKNQYSHLTTYNMLLLGLPFASIVASMMLLFFSMLDEEGMQNTRKDKILNFSYVGNLTSTDYSASSVAMDLILPLLSCNSLLLVIIITHTFSNYSGLDFLSTSAIIASFKSILLNIQGSNTAWILVLAGICMVLRLTSSWMTDGHAQYSKSTLNRSNTMEEKNLVDQEQHQDAAAV